MSDKCEFQRVALSNQCSIINKMFQSAEAEGKGKEEIVNQKLSMLSLYLIGLKFNTMTSFGVVQSDNEIPSELAEVLKFCDSASELIAEVGTMINRGGSEVLPLPPSKSHQQHQHSDFDPELRILDSFSSLSVKPTNGRNALRSPPKPREENDIFLDKIEEEWQDNFNDKIPDVISVAGRDIKIGKDPRDFSDLDAEELGGNVSKDIGDNLAPAVNEQ